MSYRQMKKKVLVLLEEEELNDALAVIAAMPARRVINPLFGLLYHGELLVRWRAVTAMGAVAAALADREMEKARIIMRRLMWNLNDESGGIGWGSPEAMGEIMARHSTLAREYASILLSFLDPHRNFLEHERLQEGLLWGVGRLAHERPQLATAAPPLLQPFFSSPVAALRGLAVWAAGPIRPPELDKCIETMRSDNEHLDIFLDGRLVRCTVGDLAKRALECMVDSLNR